MLRAVVFDWAGTVVDHGSLAPAEAFVRCFASFGLTITLEQARAPMGLAKADHIAALLGPGPGPSVADILARFEPMTIEAALARATLIPGAAETLAHLRRKGLRIASTTGYTRPIIDALAPLAAAQGFAPEITLAAGDTPEGRPSPQMMQRICAEFGVLPHEVVKVDDTAPGLAEGRNAGAWTVGVTLSGNACGLEAAALAALPPAARAPLRAKAAAALSADYLIDSVADLPPVLEQIAARLGAGDRP